MEFSEKLMTLRKSRGWSQEELGTKINVSRQTVSKWELGQTTPELDKLKELCRLFQISMDELTGLAGEYTCGNGNTACMNDKNEGWERTASGWRRGYSRRYSYSYEYRSERKLFGLPLVHIHTGRGLCRAKGIIAVGNIATGVISIGYLSLGLLSFGLLAVGLFTLGVLALGIGAFGSIAVGGIAFGGLSAGLISFGGAAFGNYAVGGVAVAKDVAIGGSASAHIAIGDEAKGAVVFLKDSLAGKDGSKIIYDAIVREFPNIWDWFAKVLAWLGGSI